MNPAPMEPASLRTDSKRRPAPKPTGGFTHTQRPNQLADPMLDDGTAQSIVGFNISAFVAVPAYTSGNAPRLPFTQTKHQQQRSRHPAKFNKPGGTLGNKAFGLVTVAQLARVTEFLVRI